MKEQNSTSDYASRIVRTFANNKVSQDAGERFYDWLTDGTQRKEKEAALAELWEGTANGHTAIGQAETDEAYRRFSSAAGLQQDTMQETPRSSRAVIWLRLWQSAAAVMIVCIGILGYMLTTLESRHTDIIQQHTPIAHTEVLKLADGTTVRLNSGSTLIYPDRFDGKTRCVYLMGEASFKVAHDKKHPFVVKADGIQVTALGTEFNVSAYPDDRCIESTLVSGSVRVDYGDMKQGTVLRPGQMLAYDTSSHTVCITTPNIADITAWQRGEVVFKEKTLSQIFSTLERKYPYSFHYSMQALGTDRYTLHFPDNAPISDVMDVIARVTGRHRYTVKGSDCYLYEK